MEVFILLISFSKSPFLKSQDFERHNFEGTGVVTKILFSSHLMMLHKPLCVLVGGLSLKFKIITSFISKFQSISKWASCQWFDTWGPLSPCRESAASVCTLGLKNILDQPLAWKILLVSPWPQNVLRVKHVLFLLQSVRSQVQYFWTFDLRTQSKVTICIWIGCLTKDKVIRIL